MRRGRFDGVIVNEEVWEKFDAEGRLGRRDQPSCGMLPTGLTDPATGAEAIVRIKVEPGMFPDRLVADLAAFRNETGSL